MRGISIRPSAPPGKARIVRDVASSILDQFVSYDTAAKLAAKGDLKVCDMGKNYPHSYMWNKGNTHGSPETNKTN